VFENQKAPGHSAFTKVEAQALGEFGWTLPWGELPCCASDAHRKNHYKEIVAKFIT
jgi:hypothetical protein